MSADEACGIWGEKFTNEQGSREARMQGSPSAHTASHIVTMRRSDDAQHEPAAQSRHTATPTLHTDTRHVRCGAAGGDTLYNREPCARRAAVRGLHYRYRYRYRYRYAYDERGLLYDLM